jgi:hypothetical protein
MEQQGQISLKLLSLTFLTKRGRQGGLRLVIQCFLLISFSLIHLLLLLCDGSHRAQWQNHDPMTLLLNCVRYHVCISAAPLQGLLLPGTPRCRVLVLLL